MTMLGSIDTTRSTDRRDEQPLDGRTTTVVGGGFGGLATACYLAADGADVTLLERHDELGGVAGRIETDGFRIDTGPSWYLMPDTFERFFSHFDRHPEEYYDLTRLDPHYRIFWKDGDRVDVPDDPEAVADLFESYEAGAGDAFRSYLEEAEHAYDIGVEEFVYRDRSRLRDCIDPRLARAAGGVTLLDSMQEYVSDCFDHPKLQQLVQYSLVFLGGAPHNTPAIYTLMSHVDFNLGVYHPTGGIASVVDGIAELATELGVDIETGCEVTGLDPGGDGIGVTARGGRKQADTVVANANPYHVGRDLLPEGRREYDDDYWDSRTYAPSAFLMYLGVEGDAEPLEHHTLVLPTDWDAHFEAIFEDPAWPEDPAYYVNVPSRTDPTMAPEGHEAVVVLVPIAAGLSDDEATRERFRDKVLDDLEAHTGADLRDRIVLERSACVSEFGERFGAPRGTALGLAHTLRQTGPFRPSIRSSAAESLYYTGAYTSPGIGMPMCLVSGQHTAAAVRDDATPGAVSRLLGRE